ncbi:MAG: hypothetical protein V2I33_06590 [Kangiellaceae bacterium]|jgi:hypothetical protein|nr:hypothetical protein [Kangiellaceae bacterium]
MKPPTPTRTYNDQVSNHLLICDKIIKRCLAVISCLLVTTSYSADTAITKLPQKIVVIIDQSRESQTFANNVKRSLEARFFGMKVDTSNRINQEEQYDLAIIVDEKSLKQLVNAPSIPAIATKISRNTYDRNSFLSQLSRDHQLAIVFQEASTFRQFILLQELMPNVRRLGVLSVRDKRHFNRVKQFIENSDKTLNISQVNEGQPIGSKALPLHLNSDAIIASISDQVINENTIKPLSQLALSTRTVIIGPSERFVGQGVLASVYTSDQQLVDEIIDEVNSFYRNDKLLGSTRYSKRFDVVIDRKVADFIGLEVRETAYYRDAIQALEISLGEFSIYE